MKPNLFDFATSELSQDAFLCWILAYADEKYIDEKLHINGKSFIQYFLDRSCGVDLQNVKTVEVYKQRESIDICVIVNDEYLIIIEDKVDSNEHSNQLQRYKNIVRNFPEVQNENLTIIPIYIKTGNDSLLKYHSIEKQGYWYCSRKDLLLLCSDFRYIGNDIANDFTSYLQSIEDDTNSYKHMLLKDWSWKAWEGFYMALEQRVCQGWKHTDWGYVANPRGGFLAFYSMYASFFEGFPYLQIEQGNLVIKIGNIQNNHKEKRQQVYELVMENAKKLHLPSLRKPDRFGLGETMTIAVVDKVNWLGRDDEIIVMDTIVNTMSKYEELIKLTVSTMRQ